MTILHEILVAFWIFAPAGAANMAPVLFKWLPFLDYPVDFGKKFRRHRIFGDHKTFRGFFVGTIIGVVIAYVQRLLYPWTQSIAMLDYNSVNVFLLGGTLGFGALLGDLIKSFFKRFVSIKPGKTWVPWDQIDWIIGALILAALFVDISAKLAVISLILFGLLHPLLNIIGYFLRIRKTKF